MAADSSKRNKNNLNIGASGEYFTAAELERRGFSVAFPKIGNSHFDMIIKNLVTDTLFSIQVKTTSFGANRWMINSKKVIKISDDFFYILVHLNELDTPDFYIIPSKVIAEYFSKINNSGKIAFTLSSEFMIYKNAWDLLIAK